MTERVQAGDLQVAKILYDFVNNEAIPGTGIDADAFWSGFSAIVHDLAPRNKALLKKRDELQEKMDAWYKEHKGQQNLEEYKDFLEHIYLLILLFARYIYFL